MYKLPPTHQRLMINLVKETTCHMGALYAADLPFNISLPHRYGTAPNVGDWFSHDYHGIFEHGASMLEDLGICQRFWADGRKFERAQAARGTIWPPFFRFVHAYDALDDYFVGNPPWRTFRLFEVAGQYLSFYSKQYLVEGSTVEPHRDELDIMLDFSNAGYSRQDGDLFTWQCADPGAEMMFGRYVWKGCHC